MSISPQTWVLVSKGFQKYELPEYQFMLDFLQSRGYDPQVIVEPNSRCHIVRPPRPDDPADIFTEVPVAKVIKC